MIWRYSKCFQICGNNWKKSTQKKLLLLQVSSIEEEKHRFFTLYLAITFLLANFSRFSQQFWNQRKILRCFDTHIKISHRKSFYVILALFWNFKARFARNGSIFWKTSKSVLELLFTPINPWTPFIFLKNIKIAVPYSTMYACTNITYSTF